MDSVINNLPIPPSPCPLVPLSPCLSFPLSLFPLSPILCPPF
jgi:hypothetical protein